MSTPNDLLRSGKEHLDLGSALRANVDSLLGVDSGASAALAALDVTTVLELALSRVFATADAIRIAGTEPSSPLGRLHVVPDELVAAGAAGHELDELAALPIGVLADLADPVVAGQVASGLGVATVRDLALWPPYLAARDLLALALGLPRPTSVGSPMSAEERDTLGLPPVDLQPANGVFPTERVFYETLVLDEIVGQPQGTDLTAAGPLDLGAASSAITGFRTPAEGAILRFSQSWFAQGLALGQLLHSVALAPGESTRIAMIDWTRRTRGMRQEGASEDESLTNSTTHGRSISEVTSAVATEAQSGFSQVRTDSSSHEGGTGGGALFIGWSDSSASSSSVGSAVSSSHGRRQMAASMTQNVSEATHQAASAVRNRRASVVQELDEQEQSTATTRTLANYNHMHALTIQYYETVQAYRVDTVLESTDRCLFIPMKLVEFDNPTTLGPQLFALRDMVFEPKAKLYLEQVLRGVLVQFDPLGPKVNPVVDPRPDAADTPAGPLAGQLEKLRTVFGNRVAVDGSELSLPPEARLGAISMPLADGTNIAVHTRGGDTRNLTVSDGTARLPEGMLLGEISSIAVAHNPTGEAETVTATLELVNADDVSTDMKVPISVGAAPVALLMSTSNPLPETAQNYLVDHLKAHRLFYNQVLWRALDPATIALLLSPYEYEGTPVLQLVDPNPVAVVGNYLVFRMHVTPEDAYAADGLPPQTLGERWHKWLADHDLLSGSVQSQIIPLPSGGVFAEAVLGRANSAEKLDITRFWNWQDSPIPLQPTEIAPPTTDTRHADVDTKPGEFPAPMVNIVAPTSLPEPVGLSAVLEAVSKESLFRDMSGLTAAAALAEAAIGASASGASHAGEMSSKNFAEMNRHKEAMFAMVASMYSGQQVKAPARDNISNSGAAINEGKKLDAKGNSDGGRGASSSGTTGVGTTGSGMATSDGAATPSNGNSGLEAASLRAALGAPVTTNGITSPQLPIGGGSARPATTTPHGSTPAEARSLVDAFRARTAASPWKLDRQAVADRLVDLIDDPTLVDQAELNVCGPAALLRLWLQRDPLAVARFATDLYDRGEAWIGTYAVRPDDDSLIAQDYAALNAMPGTVMPRGADWMILGSLRDAENLFLDFEGRPGEDVSGATTPGEIADWLEATGLYASVRDEANLVLTKGLDHFHGLNPNANRDVVLLINSHVLVKGEQVGGPTKSDEFILNSFPNHYVVLTQPGLDLGDGRVQVTYWSWGATFTRRFDADTLAANYYGAVIAER